MKILLGMLWAAGVCYVALSSTNPIANLSQHVFNALTFYVR